MKFSMQLLKSLLIGPNIITHFIVNHTNRQGPICMLMLVRDESDVVEANINFHRRMGVNLFVVTDNCSIDGTRDILSKMAAMDNDLIIIDEPGRNLDQAGWVKRMIAVAKDRHRAKWIFSCDADEFWYPSNGKYLGEINTGANILNCYWRNFLPSCEDWRFFTHIGDYFGYESGLSKAFCRAFGLFAFYYGNHGARMVPKIAHDSSNILVYHYPVRSYQSFERKIVNGCKALENNPSVPLTLGSQWRTAYKSYKEGTLPLLYERFKNANKEFIFDETMLKYFKNQACS